MKNLIKMQKLGISLDYRCPRCRSCNDCRNLSDTERVFLIEKLEDIAIRESITIEEAAEKVTVKLPLYPDVEKFLSNNKSIAAKVLDDKCNKLENDAENKEMVIKACQKMTKNK